MSERMLWFERKFTLDLPLSMYPNVVERLRGTPARLEDRVRGLAPELLTRRDGDHWSIQEHVGHLLDLEALEMSRLDDYEAGRETLTPADLQNRKTHEANYNADSIARILSSFRAERAALVARLDEYDEALVARSAVHPRLNLPMRVIDLAFFTAEHDDHHLTSITRLIRLFNKQV